MNKKYDQQKFEELTQTYFDEIEKIGIKVCFVSAIGLGKAPSYQALGFKEDLVPMLNKKSLKVTQKALIGTVKSSISDKISTIKRTENGDKTKNFFQKLLHLAN